MVDVKFSLGKRDFVWMGLIVILLGIGFGYAFGGSNPAVMGHSAEEVEISWGDISGIPVGLNDGDDNTNAVTLCPNNEFLDGDGECWTVDEIRGTGGIIACTWDGWRGAAGNGGGCEDDLYAYCSSSGVVTDMKMAC
jgi:hypothetical protein